jgi:hypothetical protein
MLTFSHPGSGIPDPGVKKHPIPDPGSGSATLYISGKRKNLRVAWGHVCPKERYRTVDKSHGASPQVSSSLGQGNSCVFSHWARNISLKGHGNEAGFIGFLQKPVQYRSLTLPLFGSGSMRNQFLQKP